MVVRSQAPSGIARRRTRLGDEETDRRMLDAAIEMVNRQGLTVSLEHLSFEDIIRDARVSRSSVYRRWPYKDLFFSDLLRELAKAATPAAVSSEETSLPEIKRIVLDHSDWLRTPELRQLLVLELIRQASVREFETMRDSTEWRTYLALHTTFLSVEDAELRADLERALGESERSFVTRIAAAWRRLIALLGYRVRPGLETTLETFATIASAQLRGLVIMAMATPEVGTRCIRAQPFGATEPADWTLSGLAMASIANAFLEPDPAIVWDDARVHAVVDAVRTLAPAAES